MKSRKRITVARAVAILNAREIVVNGKKRRIACDRTTVWRWCRDGLLAAHKDEFTGRFQPYLDAVEKFIPPKRGNPGRSKR